MVDRLKRSLNELEPPGCPNCHLEMIWYRSELVQSAPVTIDHFFQCPNCDRIQSIQGLGASGNEENPPKRLSHPREFSCAA
jgi:hypothetical protein